MARHEMSAKSGRLSPNRREGVHSPLILLESAFVGKRLELRPIQILDFDDFLDAVLLRLVRAFQPFNLVDPDQFDQVDSIPCNITGQKRVAFFTLQPAVKRFESKLWVRPYAEIMPCVHLCPAILLAAYTVLSCVPAANVSVEMLLRLLELIAAILEVELPPHPRGFLLRLFLPIAPRQLHRAFSPANSLCRGILRGELPLTYLALLHARMHRASPLA